MTSQGLLFTEIANPNRIEILQILAKSPTTFTDLTKKLDISSSEISRHLNRLTEQKLIEKLHPSRNFQLSLLGQLLITLMSPVEFILTRYGYFESHSVMDLPEEIIKNLDLLRNCEIIEGTGQVMIKMEETMKSAKKSTEIMVETPFPWGTHNLEAKYIVNHSMLAFRDNVEKMNLSTDGRVLDRVPIAMIIVDGGGGMLFFPDLKEKADFNYGFIVKSNDPLGCAFLRMIWTYFWNKGKVI